MLRACEKLGVKNFEHRATGAGGNHNHLGLLESRQNWNRDGPYVVGAFLIDESVPMPWRGLYALATPRRSFSMVFNIANVLRGGGSLMVYAAAGGAIGPG